MKIKRIFFITLITTIFIFTLDLFGAFEFLENKTYDFRTNKTVSNKTSENLFVVLLDQNSLDWASSEMNWSWPWPRSAYGDIVNFFNLANAKSLTFDVIFSEPSIYGTEDDLYFAKASEEFGKVIQIQFYDSSTKNQDIPVTSIPEIDSKSAIQGNINSIPDSDSIIRRSRLFYNRDKKSFPTLASATYLVGSENYSKANYFDTEEYKLLTTTVKFLKQADENLKVKYREPLQQSLDKYLTYIDGKRNANIDVDLKLTINENGVSKEVDYYSKGYQNLYDICKRFALTDVLFTGEKPFIILDDPFYNLDDEKLNKALELIKNLSQEYQIIYLVCHESRRG
jgi:hypothetical protein